MATTFGNCAGAEQYIGSYHHLSMGVGVQPKSVGISPQLLPPKWDGLLWP
jgi:hypothetical protein